MSALAEIGRDVLPAIDPKSAQLWAVRELAYRAVADGTDTADLVADMMRRLPAEASAYVDAYASAYRYALAAASGGAR